jgi:hypothetical protein
MKNYENIVTIFLFTILIIFTGMGAYGLYQKSTCTQSAMAQNYSADSIRKLCK